MINNNLHKPVLLEETIKLMNIKPNGVYVDCTSGRGGHASVILDKLNKNGLLICIDCDKDAINYLRNKFINNKNVVLINDNFVNIDKILNSINIKKVDGFLLDLGVSSPMFDNPERGFSYHLNGKIDMRMDQTQKLNAFDILNSWSKNELIKIFKEYGEIKNPSFVVNKIIEVRQKHPIENTLELVDIIKLAVNKKELFKHKHPARQYFQALRIATNDELNNLKKFLKEAIKYLNPSGKMLIISFHSLEDRIVKQFFNKISNSKIPIEVPIMNEKIEFTVLNKKPIIATETEIKNNNRARSAKLRGVIKQ